MFTYLCALGMWHIMFGIKLQKRKCFPLNNKFNNNNNYQKENVNAVK